MSNQNYKTTPIDHDFQDQLNQFQINVLVNGNRCKKYYHTDGNVYIEAKENSEYSIEVKNNQWKKILSIISVDGLNILTGKKCSSKDTGYIINPWSSEKLKGFRYSDTEWAKFKFSLKEKGQTYAQTKNDGSEANCGVILVKLFYEKEVPISYYDITTATSTYIGDVYYGTTSCGSSQQHYPMNLPTNCCDNNSYLNQVNINYLSNVQNSQAQCSIDNSYQKYDNTSIPIVKRAIFDTGTAWGGKETSKVTKVNFEKGNEACTFNIYYASRKSLIEMEIITEKKLQLPNGLPGDNEYCKPPADWGKY